MSGKTTIEWTHAPGYVGASWNPTTGCTRVSDGCDNCYAFALHDKRYAGNLAVAKAHRPVKYNAPERDLPIHARNADVKMPWPSQYDLPFSRVQLLPDRLDVPLRTRKPTCYFVDSMADLFHEDVPDEYLDHVWVTMDRAQQHKFLILTKRPERMRTYVNGRTRIAGTPYLPLGNAWLGTSVEDQRSADERIPHLLATPAAVRFISAEPLLGPISLGSALGWRSARGVLSDPDYRAHNLRDSGLHWVIVGGESGPRARPMDLVWVWSLVEQCRAAGVAVFVKQLGSNPVQGHLLVRETDKGDKVDGYPTLSVDLRESHGRDMAEWPEDLKVREFPDGR